MLMINHLLDRFMSECLLRIAQHVSLPAPRALSLIVLMLHGGLGVIGAW